MFGLCIDERAHSTGGAPSGLIVFGVACDHEFALPKDVSHLVATKYKLPKKQFEASFQFAYMLLLFVWLANSWHIGWNELGGLDFKQVFLRSPWYKKSSPQFVSSLDDKWQFCGNPQGSNASGPLISVVQTGDSLLPYPATVATLGTKLSANSWVGKQTGTTSRSAWKMRLISQIEARDLSFTFSIKIQQLISE